MELNQHRGFVFYTGLMVFVVIFLIGLTCVPITDAVASYVNDTTEARQVLLSMALPIAIFLFAVVSGMYAWQHGAVGKRDYLILDGDTLHWHDDLTMPTRADAVVVEVWSDGWFRTPRVLRGNQYVVLCEWRDMALTLEGKGETKDQIRMSWEMILPLLREEDCWPYRVVCEFINLQKTIADLRDEVARAGRERDAALVELITLARLTGKEDPLNWGRSKHGAEINSRLLALLAMADKETVERLRPDADLRVDAFVNSVRLVTSRPTPVA